MGAIEITAFAGAAGIVFLELALFSAVGFLLLGLGDLLIDLIWFGQRVWKRLVRGPRPRFRVGDLARPGRIGPIAIMVPAWDEAEVIGQMLARALRTLDHPNYRIYVGCYPNDPATLEVVRAVGDPRVRIVINASPGPTTKGDCLNQVWAAILADEEASSARYKTIVLHDAEDVVHADELRLFDSLIERFDMVQIPVLPIIDRRHVVAASYGDEFAESHGKEMVVREWLGAGVPSAGVGCAIAREAFEALAPMDPTSLTEDYEMGLRLAAKGYKTIFVRMVDRAGKLVAVQEYFPFRVEDAVRQKARWMVGIALAGWDRLGWRGGVAERWMRLRDRQAVLAALLLYIGYTALVLGLTLEALVGLPKLPAVLVFLLQINAALLVWRVAMRVFFSWRAYGWEHGLFAIPRLLVSNFIAMLAALRAVRLYRKMRRTGVTEWQKTSHRFPDEAPAQ